MDEITAASPPPPPQQPLHPTATSGVSKRKRGTTTSAGLGDIKKHCLSFTVSLEEGFRYVKALLRGQAKKLTAKDEKEATEADLRTSKMQVEAAAAAEDAKMRIKKSA